MSRKLIDYKLFDKLEDDQQNQYLKNSKRLIISILGEGSFFGDYQVLLSLFSNFDFISSHEHIETFCMSIKQSSFLEICDEFPKFH